jgi:hypothetical protein
VIFRTETNIFRLSTGASLQAIIDIVGDLT